MNSDMVKSEKSGHLHLVYHFTVPLILEVKLSERLQIVLLILSEFKRIN